jgi:hypothetical protein
MRVCYSIAYPRTRRGRSFAASPRFDGPWNSDCLRHHVALRNVRKDQSPDLRSLLLYDAARSGCQERRTGHCGEGAVDYNWDFGLDSQRTNVTQSVRIQLVHSIGVVTSWAHADSGEASSLIYGSFYEAGHNTCFSIF